MSRDWLQLSVGWRRRPEAAEATARRVLRMLRALEAIDSRFTNLLEGGHSPDPTKGWRPLVASEEAILSLLLRSDKNARTPGFAGVIRLGFGAWNGHPDEGTSVGLSVSTEGPVPDPFGLRSFAIVDCGIDGLTSAQVDAVVAALMEAWDPDDATREDYAGGRKSVTKFARRDGWRTAE